MAEPTHSVVVPVFNGERHVGDCISSILPELGVDDELIVVDNGSTDGTLAILSGFSDSRIVVLHQPRRGASAARNMGIDRARGRYVAFQDHDDLWPPGRQAALVRAMQTTAGANAAHGRMRMLFEQEPDPRYVAMDGQYVAQFSLLTSIFDRSLLGRVGPMDETLKLSEDVDYLIRLRDAGMLAARYDGDVHIRRRHETNITLTDRTPIRAQMMQILRRNIARRRLAK